MATRSRWTDIVLALAAIFIAFVLWLIAKQDDLGRSWVKAAVVVENVPDNMIIQAPPEVDLHVQFTREASRNIVSKNFTINIEADQLFSADPTMWGDYDSVHTVNHDLTERDVQMRHIDGGVQLLRFEPSRLTLEARLLTQKLPVLVATEGELPKEYELISDPRPEPDSVIVTGSHEQLAALAESQAQVMTEPINLAQITHSKQEFPSLVAPEGVRVISLDDTKGRITVNVAVREKNIRRTFEDVGVELLTLSSDLTLDIKPPTVAVTVEGPPSVLDQLPEDAFSFNTTRPLEERADHLQEVGLEVSLKKNLPGSLLQQITIVECKPSTIKVAFKALSGQNGEVF